MSLADKIKQARLKRGFTQKELASLLGITAHNISQYETGRRTPKPATLQKLADAIGCSMFDFWEQDSDKAMSQSEQETDSAFNDLIASGLLANANEEILIRLYRSLNARGRDRLVAYAEELAQIAKYKVNSNDIDDK